MNIENGEYKDLLVPSRLNTAIEASINKARKDKRRKKIRSGVFKYSSVAASLILVFGIGASLLSSVKNSFEPGQPKTQLSSIFMFNRDYGIRVAAQKGFGQNINLSETDNGIKFTIDDVMADSKRIVLSYTLSVENGYNDLQNLLIKDFTIKGPNNSIISTSKESSVGITPDPNTFLQDNKDPLLKIIRYNYTFASPETSNFDTTITSYDGANKDFKTTRRSQGTIEISRNWHFDTTVPEVIELHFTKLLEDYYQDKSKDDSTTLTRQEFMEKYGREAIEVNGNWGFTIKLDEILKGSSPLLIKEFNNPSFKIEDTQFNIEYIDISPLRADMKITNNNKDFETLIFSSHLEDEHGNKYYYIRGGSQPLVQKLTFESCYFDKPENLYLVIDRINYQFSYNRKDIQRVENIRVKIK